MSESKKSSSVSSPPTGDDAPRYTGGQEHPQGAWAKLKSTVDLWIAIPALLFIVGIATWAIGLPEPFEEASTAAFEFLVTNFGWLFIIMATVFFAVMIALAFSRYGHIKLGRDDELPEFSTPSWIAMMFAAGMGIGLLFYGGYEPLSHYRDGVPGHPPEDTGTAFAQTLLHFGPIAWATYAVVGVSIAYTTFRLGRPQLISAACAPLIGVRRAEGPIGKLIDILAIFATVFSTAMSLGLGASQIAAGAASIGAIKEATVGVMLVIIGLLSVGYLVSAMSGVARGVQWVSNFNMATAAMLSIFILIFGPTIFILNTIPLSIGDFISQLPEMLGRSASSSDPGVADWMAGWTIFYWVWWIAWTPFVGMFLARISRGRTIREFVVGIVVVPSSLIVLWFAIFGGTAIHFEQTDRSIWGDGRPEAMLFELLGNLPWPGIISAFTIMLLATFFITTADSASTVMGSMSQRGRVNPTPIVTGIWGLMTTLIAVALLLTGGEEILTPLQRIIIVSGSPFMIVVVIMMLALIKGVQQDPTYQAEREARRSYLRLVRENKMMEVGPPLMDKPVGFKPGVGPEKPKTPRKAKRKKDPEAES